MGKSARIPSQCVRVVSANVVGDTDGNASAYFTFTDLADCVEEFVEAEATYHNSECKVNLTYVKLAVQCQ